MAIQKPFQAFTFAISETKAFFGLDPVVNVRPVLDQQRQ